MLRDALLALVYEHGWDAVSVQMVCERANVGRSTFYTHFADKEDLLVSGFDDLRKTLSKLGTTGGKKLGFAHPLIVHAYDNRRLFRALIGKRSGQVAQNRFRQLVVDLTKAELASAGVTGPKTDAIVRYVAGAFTELLIWSLDHAKPDAEALDGLFQQLTAPVLARAVKLAREADGA